MLCPPRVACLCTSYTWLHLDHIHSMKDFYKDASNGDLPAYTWLEPKYYDLFGDAAQDEVQLGAFVDL